MSGIQNIPHPLLKKPNLDPKDFKNYRPIANLMFIAKVLEKIASTQLNTNLLDNHLFSEAQSTYRKFHSTETSLTK